MQQGCGFGLENRFHHQLAAGIHDRYRDRCLMNIEPNILFASQLGAPFVGDELHTHNLPQGAPFHNALSPAIQKSPASALPVIRERTGKAKVCELFASDQPSSETNVE
jgi:hypothetical protein